MLPSQQIPSNIWRASRSTEHVGGFFATQRLFALCPLPAGQIVLDIGCGTGYTAHSLAEQRRARVIALDLTFTNLLEARKRRVHSTVALLQGDAHNPPFRDGQFDAVILESLLVFCDATKVLAAAHRVLREGGILYNNEMTLRGAPPPELRRLLVETLGLQPHAPQGWQQLFHQAGFEQLAVEVHPIRLREQLLSHVHIDGLFGYLGALRRGLAESELRQAFINRELLRAAPRLARTMGYHLYVGQKIAAD